MIDSGFYYEDALITLKFAIIGLAIRIFTASDSIATWWLRSCAGSDAARARGPVRSDPRAAAVLGSLIGYNERTVAIPR